MIQLFHLILRPQIQVLNRHRCLKGALCLMRPRFLRQFRKSKVRDSFLHSQVGKNSIFKTNEKLNLEKIRGVFVSERKTVTRFLGNRMFKTDEFFTFVYILFALFSLFCSSFTTVFRLTHGLFASKSRSDSWNITL